MDITKILELVIAILTTGVITYIIPILVNKYGIEKIRNTYEIIKILVHAVEQVTTVTGAGKEKKKEVIEKLKNNYNITLDEKVVSDLIESAVLEMKNSIDKKAD